MTTLEHAPSNQNDPKENNTEQTDLQAEALTPRQQTVTAERGRRRISRAAIALGTAATAVVALVAVGLANRKEVVNGEGHAANRLPVATSTPNSGQKTGDGTPETLSTVGNIDLGHPIEGPHGNIDFVWNNKNVSVPKLLTPNTSSPNQSATSVLNVLSELISTQQTKYSDGMAYFTENNSLAQIIGTYNAMFQGSEQKPYADQLEFYDTPEDPVQFVADGVDDSGNPVIRMEQGTLYAQRVTGHEWQDDSQHNPADAIAITADPSGDGGFSFSYKLSPDGSYMTVESLTITPSLPAIVRR